MIKLGFILFSFLAINLNHDINMEYMEIITEEKSNEEILDQVSNYELVREENTLYLRTRDRSWERILPSNSDYQSRIVKKDYNCAFFYLKDGFLNVIEYNPDGEILNEKQILDNRINPVFSIIYEDGFYLAASVSEYTSNAMINAKSTSQEYGLKDALLVKFDLDYQIDTMKIYGGVLNDSFEKITMINNVIYVMGRKDPLSGGDFGNGGTQNQTCFIAKLDSNLLLTDYQILSSNQKLLFFQENKDYLVIGLSDLMYQYNFDLELVKKTENSEMIKYAFITNENQIILFSNNKYYLYSLPDMIIDYEKELAILNNSSIKKLNEIILITSPTNKYYFDIANLNNFNIPKIYNPELDLDKRVNSLFSDCELVSETSNPIFNSLVFGNYIINYQFKNAFGSEFIVQRTVEVKKRANVQNNMIYPIGYRLEFSGNAFLNSKSIVNNYQMDKPGDYVLELYGIDNEREEIRFTVDSEQIQFKELDLRYWDKEIGRNTDFYLEFNYVTDFDFIIDSIIINNQIYENIIFDKVNKLISVKMTSPNDVGIYTYYIDSIFYYENNQIEENQENLKELKFSKVNQVFTLNVLNQVLSLTINQTEVTSFSFDVDDVNTARYFEVKLYNDSFEEIYQYSLSSQNLLINGLDKDYKVSISLVYDLGNKILDKVTLLETNIILNEEVIDIGDIEVIERSESLKNFLIKLDEDKVSKIGVDNTIFYEKVETKLMSAIISGIVGFVIVLILTRNLKIFYKKKRNNNFSK